MNRNNREAIPLKQTPPLETNLDIVLSRSLESLYSVQTVLESIDERSKRS